MENDTLAGPPVPIDYAFLETVEAAVGESLARLNELHAGVLAPVEPADHSWHELLERMAQNLTSWQIRLGEFSRQTAAIESELSAQEQSMRHWLQSLGLTSQQLASVSKH